MAVFIPSDKYVRMRELVAFTDCTYVIEKLSRANHVSITP